MAANGKSQEVDLIDVVDRAPDGVMVVDKDGVVVWANRSAVGVFAPATGTLVGRPLGRPILTGAPQRIEVVDAAGQYRSTEMVATEVGTPDDPLFVISLRDLSDHDRQRVQLRRRLDEQDEMLSVVYDDASDRVASLLLMVDELDHGWEALSARERQGMVRLIGLRLDRLADLIDTWNGGLRDRASLIDSQFEPVNLFDIVTEGLSEWRERNEEVALVIEPGTTVCALPTHVWAVVRALLDNAFKHGDPPVTLVAHTRADVTLIEVIDHGPGLDAEIRDRLRLGYAYRSDETGPPRDGHGLWLARSLVKAYGGSLHHQNVLGGGTRFLCSFPARPSVSYVE